MQGVVIAELKEKAPIGVTATKGDDESEEDEAEPVVPVVSVVVAAQQPVRPELCCMDFPPPNVQRR